VDAVVADLIEGHEVTTIEAGASVHDAAVALRDHAIGSLLVTNGDEEPCGIVTDRDLAVRVVGSPVDPEVLCVRDVMTSPLVSVEPSESLDAVLDRMKARGIRRVPVVQDGKLLGLVTFDEVLELLAMDATHLAREWRRRQGRSLRDAKLEHVRDEVEQGLESVQMWLRKANWTAREAFLAELDDIRERIGKAIHSD
jgi:signal-transduction protein with cAMP-binding, CBS, and nucleotidyltransferase domain